MDWYITAGGGHDNPWEGEQADALRQHQGCEFCDSPEGLHRPDCVTFLSDDPARQRRDFRAITPKYQFDHDFHKRMNGRGWYL